MSRKGKLTKTNIERRQVFVKTSQIEFFIDERLIYCSLYDVGLDEYRVAIDMAFGGCIMEAFFNNIDVAQKFFERAGKMVVNGHVDTTKLKECYPDLAKY